MSAPSPPDTPAATPWSSPLAARLSLGLSRGALRAGRVGLLRIRVLGRWWRTVWRGGRVFHARSADGTRLHALFISAQSATQPAATPAPGGGAMPPNPPGPTASPALLPIILAHGYAETKEFHLPRAWRLARAGHDVILFDHRAHGRSGGACVTFGVRERQDMQAVLDAAQSRGWIGPRVVSIGYSLGGATALLHAALDPRVAAVAALAPFVHLEQAIESYRRFFAPWTDPHWLRRGFAEACREAGFALDEAAPIASVRDLHLPVLLIVGTADRNLGPQEHSRVLATAKTSGWCRLIEIPGATHVSLVRRNWPGMDEAILEFCAAAR